MDNFPIYQISYEEIQNNAENLIYRYLCRNYDYETLNTTIVNTNIISVGLCKNQHAGRHCGLGFQRYGSQ